MVLLIIITRWIYTVSAWRYPRENSVCHVRVYFHFFEFFVFLYQFIHFWLAVTHLLPQYKSLFWGVYNSILPCNKIIKDIHITKKFTVINNPDHVYRFMILDESKFVKITHLNWKYKTSPQKVIGLFYLNFYAPVSYTHLTLPTILLV